MFHKNDEILGNIKPRVELNSCEIKENGWESELWIFWVKDVKKLAGLVYTYNNHMNNNDDDLCFSFITFVRWS